MRPIERIIDALESAGCKPRPEGHGWRASCPSSRHEHGNRKSPALHVEEGDLGAVLVTCHAGCELPAILDGLGLELGDLFADGDRQGPESSKPSWVSIVPIPPDAPDPEPHPRLGQSSVRYPYRTADGRGLLGWVCRWDTSTGKEIRPLTFGRMSNEPDSAARWEWRSWSGLAPLFSLDLLAQRPAAPVLVCEGEKAALAARALFPNLVAITSAGGSNRAAKGDWEPLKGRSIVIWPDADEPGSKYSSDVARLTAEVGAAAVAVVEVPTEWPKGWDVADDLPAGVSVEDLRAMVENSKPTKAEPATRARPLREWLEDPDILKPPQAVAPMLGYAGRLLALIGREKGGKSTILAHAAAAATCGGMFAGQRLERCLVLWVGLEESPGDTVRRFKALGADLDSLVFCDAIQIAKAELEMMIAEWSPAWVVIDSLVRLGESWNPSITEWSNSGQVAPLINWCADLAHKGQAVTITHHAKKSDGQYRDSTAIGAGVDMLVTLTAVKNSPTERHLSPLGRFNLEARNLILTSSGFEPTDGEPLSVRDAVVRYIGENPGCSKNEVNNQVTGNRTKIFDVVNELVNSGDLEDRGEGTKWALYLAGSSGSGDDSQNHPRTTPEPLRELLSGSGNKPMGTRVEPLQNHFENHPAPEVPLPPIRGRNRYRFRE